MGAKPPHRIVVVGHGAAGLTAALAASEAAIARGVSVDVTVVERAAEGAHGGNTRWTPCYMRLEAPDRLSDGFVDDILSVSGGHGDQAYFETLAAQAPHAMGWLQGHGIAFHTPVYYLSVGPPRIQPVGGGETIVRELTRAAKAAEVRFIYGCEADSLVRDTTGAINGLKVRRNSATSTLAADTIVLASGGFQGDSAWLAQQFGPHGATMKPISPGTRLNTGAGIRMALEIGAKPAGDWNGMHAEPVDPRSANSAPVVLVYPYGVVVDRTGRRFFDEGAGLVHETWEQFARAIQFERPGGEVYAILDSSLLDITNYQRAIRSEVAPYQAKTLNELANLIGVPADTLSETVATYNAAATGDPARFDATLTDGLRASSSLQPPKSNWARALTKPPYLAYPLIGAIAYTFGGLATDIGGRVLGNDGPIPGLYAAGEITGHFHGTAPNAVAVLRAVVFGRIAGQSAVQGI